MKTEVCGSSSLNLLAMIAAILTGLASVFPVLASCTGSRYPGPAESIAMGTISGTLWQGAVAERRQFFGNNGITLNEKEYASGVDAVDAMERGEVDIAIASEYPIINHAFNKREIGIIASFNRSFSTAIIARRDRGIQSIPDLKGKRVGVARRTIFEFYLGRFLELHGLNIKDVTLSPTTPAQAVDDIKDLDAVVTYDMFTPRMEQVVPSGLITWQAQNDQATYHVFVARKDWIKRNEELIKRFLRAVDGADSYLKSRPDEARAIARDSGGLDDVQIAILWPEQRFGLSLDQSLVLAMEDEARWTINNNLTTEKQVPDFRDYIYLDGMRAVKPEAVNIIR